MKRLILVILIVGVLVVSGCGNLGSDRECEEFTETSDKKLKATDEWYNDCVTKNVESEGCDLVHEISKAIIANDLDKLQGIIEKGKEEYPSVIYLREPFAIMNERPELCDLDGDGKFGNYEITCKAIASRNENFCADLNYQSPSGYKGDVDKTKKITCEARAKRDLSYCNKHKEEYLEEDCRTVVCMWE